MSFQSKMISTMLVSALTLGLVQTADAQEAEFVDQPLTATAMKGDTKIADIPVLEYTPKETKSPIKVTGTQEWDKSLSLSPENGDVTVNLDLSGKVPAGTKVALMDGTTELATTTVDAAGKVTLTAKDLPKDVKKLSLIAKGEGVTGLQNVKCVADKGIDIPASKKATEEAVQKFEKEYVEAAQKNAKNAGGESGETAKPGEETKKVEGEAGEPYVTTTVITKPGEKKTIKEGDKVVTSTKKGTPDKVEEKTDVQDIPWDKGSADKTGSSDKGMPVGAIVGGLAAIAAGGAIISTMWPMIEAQLKSLQARIMGGINNKNNNFQFNGTFNGFDLGAFMREITKNFQESTRGGKKPTIDGLFGNLPDRNDVVKRVRDSLKRVEDQFKRQEKQLQAQIAQGIQDLKKGGFQISAQLENFFKNVKLTDLIIVGLIIIALVAIILISVSVSNPDKDKPNPSTKKTTVTGKTTIPGKPGEKVITTLPGGEKVVEGDPVVETITTTITPSGKVLTPENPEGSTPGKTPGDLPTPPEFIEKTLPSRDLATENVDSGVGFSVEVGSVIDCTASVDGSETPDPTPKPKEPSTDETITQRETKKNRKAESCAVLEKDEAAGKIKGGISSIKPGDALWNAALDADGNGVMCDEGDDPAPRPKTPKANAPEPKSPEAPAVQQQRKPVTIAPAGQAPAPVAPVQQQAAVPMQAAPAYGVKYGPKVDTGAEVEGSFINTIVTFVTGR